MKKPDQAEIHPLPFEPCPLTDFKQTQTLQATEASLSKTDHLPQSDATTINQELDRIGILANTVAHQYEIISLIGLPSVSRDVALMAKLASSSCAKAVNACFRKNTNEAYAAQEDYTALAQTYHRLSARFYSALGQPDSPVETLMAGWAVVACIAKIGHHASRIATMTA